MFRRDIDHFRFENGPHRFFGQGPPGHYGPPPPLTGPPPFGAMPPFFGAQFKPPMPMNREAFQEIRDYVLLLIISDYSGGITGYQLQEKYKIPRGTLIRILQDLVEKNYLSTKEEIVDGRANKFYLITKPGKDFLEQMKLKWANLFGMLAEFNPAEQVENMMINKVEEFNSKEDAIDFFRGVRSLIKEILKWMEEHINRLIVSKEELNIIIDRIEKMNTIDKQQIKDLVIESIKKTN